eukprot:COSAG02_NODE_8860_length_2418_cov_2.103062_3_plen_162_part_00
MTESERRYHEKKLARDVERAKQSAHTSHRERVNVRAAIARAYGSGKDRYQSFSSQSNARSYDLGQGIHERKGLDANEKRLTQPALPATKATEQRSVCWRGSQLTDAVNLLWRHRALSEFSYYATAEPPLLRYHPSASAKRTTLHVGRGHARRAFRNGFLPF